MEPIEYDKIRNGLTGLSSAEAAARLQKSGPNTFQDAGPGIWEKVRSVVLDPMLLLLIGTAVLYFVLGKAPEGLLMVAAIILITSISFYQEYRSGRALKALRKLMEPKVRVLRDGKEAALLSALLVPGDIVLISEGEKIPADARILEANDLTVNESLLTGESFPVDKGAGDLRLFQGTLINTGRCTAEVTATGMRTELGKLGKAVTSITQQPSALQRNTYTVVRRLSLLGLGVFVAVFVLNLLQRHPFLDSLLSGLALAMAAIPEEIPVAFTAFMALGAARLSRQGIITRQPQTVENLGALGVLCLDKTGTITENRMELRFVYDGATGVLQDFHTYQGPPSRALRFGMLASEQDPFDEMEKAIARQYQDRGDGTPRPPMVHEYPLSGRPPMMTHMYGEKGAYTAAAKGAPERVLPLCRLSEARLNETTRSVDELTAQGFRLLAVASAERVPAFLPAQEDYPCTFEGLLALYDPPKPEAPALMRQLRNAGISVKLLTGDHPATAAYIAGATGLASGGSPCTGDDVLQAGDEQLEKLVRETQVFARMSPEAKKRVIETLRRQGAVVGMTGDGVNDAPALKAADIGIAMGHRGTELSRQAADLVLSDDSLQKILLCISVGRGILENIRKVARYIVSLHIPIFMVALIPLLATWRYENLFSPIHVIFLELIMGPTCSLFYEREPASPRLMQVPPRPPQQGLLLPLEWRRSVALGLAIGAGLLILCYFMMQRATIGQVRAAAFIGLLCCNVLLTFTNRSADEPLWRTWATPNPLQLPLLLGSTAFAASLLLLPPLRRLFELEVPSPPDLFVMLLLALISTLWTEPLKRQG